jgi:hypothetical protein
MWRYTVLKRGILIYCLTLSLSLSLLRLPVQGFEQLPDVKSGIPYEYTPKEGSIEELYKDIIARLLVPYIDKEIKKYYGRQYMYDLWSMKFLRIERLDGYRSFAFTIAVEVQPFIGAHNTVGIDEMTIKIEGETPTIENFKHIKSFPIPKYLQ